MTNRLYDMIEQINNDYRLEIDLDSIAEIYGPDFVEQLAQTPEDVSENIQYLISLGFGESVSDICNRFGILLYEDPADFARKVRSLVDSIGENYVDIMGEDMSAWEALL